MRWVSAQAVSITTPRDRLMLTNNRKCSDRVLRVLGFTWGGLPIRVGEPTLS
jgi:hypothetical protein